MYIHKHTDIQIYTQTYYIHKEIFPDAKLVEIYEPLASGAFRLEMVVQSWFSIMLYFCPTSYTIVEAKSKKAD